MLFTAPFRTFIEEWRKNLTVLIFCYDAIVNMTSKTMQDKQNDARQAKRGKKNLSGYVYYVAFHYFGKGSNGTRSVPYLTVFSAAA